MGAEIERRFLVRLDVLRQTRPPEWFEGGGALIEQSYLAKDPWIRVRRKILDGVVEAELTIKGRGTLVRPEYSYDIPVEESYELDKLARFGRITKLRRWCGSWEIDEFRGALAGLWLAEIELPDEHGQYDRHPWLGREVTYDERFTNAHLAEYGLPAE
jgi:CYTH domain-containing protein